MLHICHMDIPYDTSAPLIHLADESLVAAQKAAQNSSVPQELGAASFSERRGVPSSQLLEHAGLIAEHCLAAEGFPKPDPIAVANDAAARPDQGKLVDELLAAR